MGLVDPPVEDVARSRQPVHDDSTNRCSMAGDTPRLSPRVELALGGRQLEGLGHGWPGALGRLTDVEGRTGGAAVDCTHDLRADADVGVAGAELALHPIPDLAVTHERSEAAETETSGAMEETLARWVASSMANR